MCEKLQKKNLEKRKDVTVKAISFEQQMEIIKRISVKKRNNCCVHSNVYNMRRDSKRYCSLCQRACCPEHFAANGYCYLCNKFDERQIKELDKEMEKHK